MTEYLLSIDPGVSTGIALLSYSPDKTPELVRGWQFTGGVSALKEWLTENWRESGWFGDYDDYTPAGLYNWMVGAKDYLSADDQDKPNPDWQEGDPEDDCLVLVPANLTIVAEKFTARNTRGFAYTTAALEPLRCEGALIAKEVMPDYTPKEKVWRDPSLQYLVGGEDLADKKKRQHAFLKDIGFYRTGKDFGTPDADDFRSAAAHGLAYLMREVKHRPTYELISDWTEHNGR